MDIEGNDTKSFVFWFEGKVLDNRHADREKNTHKLRTDMEGQRRAFAQLRFNVFLDAFIHDRQRVLDPERI